MKKNNKNIIYVNINEAKEKGFDEIERIVLEKLSDYDEVIADVSKKGNLIYKGIMNNDTSSRKQND